MARFDRCRVCDYTESNGSPTLGINPGQYGKVRRFGEDYLCDACSFSIDQARADFRPPNETDEKLEGLEE